MEEVSAQLIEDSNGAKGDENEQQQASKDDLGEPRVLPLPMEHKDERKESPPSRDMIVSAITPRVKFKMSIHERGVTFTSPKEEEIIITANACAIQHVIFFPKREDCLQKPKINNEERRVLIPGSMVLLFLVEDKVSFRKKSLTQICFQLPQHYSDPIPVDASMSLVSEEDVSQASLALEEEEEVRLVCIDSFEENIMRLLKSALQLENIYRVYNPKYNNVDELQDYTFQSDDGGANQSIMQGKMPYLKCYHGVNDGVIYPMEEGLLFFKPPFFVHRSRLHSIAIGRGGGSRYVDLQAIVDGEEGDDEKEQIEFTNIDREEMQVLNTYIHNVLVKAMARDIAGDGEGDGEDEEEQGFEKADPTSDSGNEGPSRKRYRRAASLEASEVIRRKLTKKSGNSQQGEEEEEDDDDDDEYQADAKGGEEEEEDDDDDAEDDDDDDDDDDDEDGEEEEEETESDATVSEEEE